MGSRSTQYLIQECDGRCDIALAASIREGCILPASPWSRYDRSLVQAPLKSTFYKEPHKHCHEPYFLFLQEYMHNIHVVDNIVQQAEALISQFYQDDETSYIFTADHGMSVIGNHGDGGKVLESVSSSSSLPYNYDIDPDSTRTPLITWGRGLRGPLPDSLPSSHDSYSEPWRLNHLLRRDVEQADVAALMASLLGINWPVNSVGVLPDVDPTRPGYMLPHLGDETLAQAALVNAKVRII